jgi:tetratricopeptide (TPR) repeat protein
MSNSPAPSNTKLSVKLGLNDDLRRFSVESSAFTFSFLKEMIAKLYKSLSVEEVEQLQIRYQDNEMDWISVSSDEELAEAVHLLPNSNAVLRLTIQKPAQQQFVQPFGHPFAGHPFAGHPFGHRFGEGRGRWAERCGGGMGRWGQKCGRRGPHEEREKQPAEGCEGNEASREGCGFKKRGFGRGKYFFLQQQGHALMMTGKPEMIKEARALFQQQLSIFEHPTPMYNLACCDALLGNTNEALEQLRKAIAAGFCDVNHIENDADLVSLRALPEYQALIAQLKASPPTQPAQKECKKWGRFGGRGKYHGLHKRAIKLMEAGTPSDFQIAKSLYELILNSIAPNDPLALYNLACCESQLGNSQAALISLQKAISAGFNNVAHMEADADFASIRETPAFQALVAAMKNGSSSSSAQPAPVPAPEQPTVVTTPEPTPAPVATPDPTPVSAPEPSVPTPAPVPEDSRMATLQSMGFTDRRQNEDALARANGDLATAVQFLLAESGRMIRQYW